MTYSRPSLPTVRVPRPRLLLGLLAGLVLLIVVVVVGTNIYTQLLLYRSLGYASVYDTILVTKVVLFVVGGLVVSFLICLNLAMAYRLRPAFVPAGPEQNQLERYRSVLVPLRRWLLGLVALVVFVVAGAKAAAAWQTVQLYLHATKFGVSDPQFHRDIGYYAFTYPFERMVLAFLFTAVVLALVGSLVVHYLLAGIRVQARGARTTPAARAHISVLLGVFVLLKAAAYYLDRYGLNFSPRGNVTGAGYSDIHATLPAKTILLVIAVICALLFFANVRSRGFALPGIALGLLVLSALVIGGIYPAIVQQFSVKPNEINLEAPYIERNIVATQAAYQIQPKSTPTAAAVDYSNYDGSATPPASLVAADPGLANSRLVDPNVVGSDFEQLQQIRSYYSFPTLNVDRYVVNGKEQEYVVGVRDVNLSGVPGSQGSWPNNHLIYTHGDGFVAAPVNTVDGQGRPVFADGEIPTTGPNGAAPAIPVSQPRIYFGQNSPAYSIVHTTQQEIDGADSTSAYAGDGGVSIGSEIHRVLYAIKFHDINILLSSSLTSQSRILYARDPGERVHLVAPWLTLDSDPYPAVVNGQVVWIVDGYTTTNMYPYSERTSLASASATTTTGSSSTSSINYIRNSVKATVNAYTGAVTLYAWDPNDPVLRAWESVFPGVVKPLSDISPELRAHLRYPEDLFDVQRSLIARYHVSNPKTFYRGNDFWSVPTDPTNANRTDQPPYYQMLQVPGQSKLEFDLTSDMVAINRPNLSAFISVSSDAPDYGVMRVLQLPTGTGVQGPANVANTIESDRTVSSDLTLLRGGGSHTVLGNLLTVPIGGGFVFEYPIYVQSSSAQQTFPTLQDVAVSVNGQVGFGSSLAAALVELLGASPPGTQGLTSGVTPSTPSTAPPTSSHTAASATVKTLIGQAQSDQAAAQAALRAGNFAAYGSEESKLATVLTKLATAAGAGAAPSKSK